MNAIDFASLMKKEKLKARKQRNNKNKSNTKNDDATPPIPAPKPTTTTVKSELPPWSHPPSVLSFDQLNLKTICETNPKTISYSPQTLKNTKPLEDWLLALPSGDSGLEEWKTMSFGKRRVAMFGELSAKLPEPLQEIAEELVKRGIFPPTEPPNHVLLNDYQPSQGILPHTDGPLYQSRTATLSLVSDVVLEFTKRLSFDQIGNSTRSKQEEAPIQIFLQAGSLIVFEDEAYSDYCHGIPMDVWQDTTTEKCLNQDPNQVVPRGRRFSLTFRHKKSKT